MRLTALILTLSLLASACGGGGDSGGDAAAPEESAETADSTPMGNASISGTVSFDGAAPERGPERMNDDCYDEREEEALTESVIVNDGAVQNVFVYVSAGLPDGYSYATPTDAVVLDQEGCQYTPRVLGMQAGQTLRIENSDPFQHNVHPFPEHNRGFNESTPSEGDYLEKTFLVPEIVVSVRCDVHAWMQAYVGVMDHPYYATTGADGTFAIEGLPAGTYTVTTWHESFGEQRMEVTVGDAEAGEASFTYSAAS